MSGVATLRQWGMSAEEVVIDESVTLVTPVTLVTATGVRNPQVVDIYIVS